MFDNRVPERWTATRRDFTHRDRESYTELAHSMTLHRRMLTKDGVDCIQACSLDFPLRDEPRAGGRGREGASYAREKFENASSAYLGRPACGLIAPLYFLFRAVDR
jgi:hypothetical protein